MNKSPFLELVRAELRTRHMWIFINDENS